MRPLAALVALTTLLLASTTCGAPVGNVTKIADGFAWLENLWFDTKGGLYASDFYKGTLWKWTRDPVTGTINQTKWLAPGWIEIFGISESPFPDTILVVAVYNLTSSGIEVVSTEEPNVHYQLARTPRAGNGLAFNPANGWVYTPNEGFFIPTLSETMAFNVAKRNQSSADGIIDASIFQSGMTAADGTWVDVEDQLLYLTDSIQGRVMVYNVSNIAEAAFGNKSFLYSYSAPGCTTVDDLCVSHDLPRGVRPPGHRTPYVFIADFLGGALRSFDATGAGAAQTWATGFHSLTSARQGRGNGWDSDCIFVTEGGTLDPFETNRGLWQVRLTKTLE